jgi:putative transposase
VHFGLATDKADHRRTVLTQARAQHPHRFGTAGTPKILDLPDTAWINRPAQNTTQETATTAAEHPLDSSTLKNSESPRSSARCNT